MTQRPGLSGMDVAGIAVVWAGVVGAIWVFSQMFVKIDPTVPIVGGLIAGYYLSRWIILKKGPDE